MNAHTYTHVYLESYLDFFLDSVHRSLRTACSRVKPDRTLERANGPPRCAGALIEWAFKVGHMEEPRPIEYMIYNINIISRYILYNYKF